MSMPRYRSLAMVHPDFDADAGPPGLRVAPGGGLASVSDAASVRQSLLLLSTRTGHWFIERGFVECATDELPMEKKSLYNFQRNSKILCKKLGSSE